VEESGPLGKSRVQNRDLDRIEEQLRAQGGGSGDGLCLYLLGVILAHKCGPPPVHTSALIQFSHATLVIVSCQCMRSAVERGLLR